MGYPLHATSRMTFSVDDGPEQVATIRQTESALNFEKVEVDFPDALTVEQVAALDPVVRQAFRNVREHVISFPGRTGVMVSGRVVEQDVEVAIYCDITVENGEAVAWKDVPKS
jgi:hypothetical protein